MEKKPLARSGAVGRRAGGAEVVPRAAEALVDEHRDRSRARRGVGGRDHGRVGVGPQVAGRRRAALDLRDRAEAGLRERVVEASHQPGSSALKRDERVEAARGGAGVDRLGAERDALDEVVGEPRRDERAGGVQQHGIAPAARLAGEHGADRSRRSRPPSRRAAPPGRLGSMPRSRGSSSHSLHVAVDDLDDEARSRRRELVEAAFAVDDERAPGAELGERLGEQRHERGRVDAEDAVARARPGSRAGRAR